MKKVLVTGGAGFLGSHLCERLLNAGYFVFCLDNLHTGTEKNIAHLEKHARFTFVFDDVSTLKFREPVAEIYNLACPASPVHYQEDPIATIQTCVQGAIKILDLARMNSSKVLQASTSEVYGDPLEHPQRETYCGNVSPNGPRSCYDEGKRVAESIFYTYHLRHGVDIRIPRIFNTYGPRMDRCDGRVVSNFIVCALEGKPLEIYGDGTQTRSFCYVDDLIDGLIGVMTNEFEGPTNLGNPEEFTIKQLAGLVLAEIDSKAEIAYLPLPKDDPTRRRPDISKAQRICGFTPKTPLHQGLLKTIAYFKS